MSHVGRVAVGSGPRESARSGDEGAVCVLYSVDEVEGPVEEVVPHEMSVVGDVRLAVAALAASAVHRVPVDTVAVDVQVVEVRLREDQRRRRRRHHPYVPRHVAVLNSNRGIVFGRDLPAEMVLVNSGDRSRRGRLSSNHSPLRAITSRLIIVAAVNVS